MRTLHHSHELHEQSSSTKNFDEKKKQLVNHTLTTWPLNRNPRQRKYLVICRLLDPYLHVKFHTYTRDTPRINIHLLKRLALSFRFSYRYTSATINEHVYVDPQNCIWPPAIVPTRSQTRVYVCIILSQHSTWYERDRATDYGFEVFSVGCFFVVVCSKFAISIITTPLARQSIGSHYHHLHLGGERKYITCTYGCRDTSQGREPIYSFIFRRIFHVIDSYWKVFTVFSKNKRGKGLFLFHLETDSRDE